MKLSTTYPIYADVFSTFVNLEGFGVAKYVYCSSKASIGFAAYTDSNISSSFAEKIEQ